MGLLSRMRVYNAMFSQSLSLSKQFYLQKLARNVVVKIEHTYSGLKPALHGKLSKLKHFE